MTGINVKCSFVVLAALWSYTAHGCLTIGWIEIDAEGNDEYKTAVCRNDSEITIPTWIDYFKLYSSSESSFTVRRPCYCQVFGQGDDLQPLKHALLTLSVYNEDKFEVLLKLNGAHAWGLKDYWRHFDFEVAASENPSVILSNIDTILPLNSTIYFVISNATVNMRCQTDPYPPVIIPSTSDGTEEGSGNGTVVTKNSKTTPWYGMPKFVIIATVVVTIILLLVTLLYARIMLRLRAKQRMDSVEATEWQTSSAMAQNTQSEGWGTDSPNGDAAIVEHATSVEPSPSTSKASSPEAHISLDKSNTKSRDILVEGTIEREPKSPLVNPPDVIKRGIYDNVEKEKAKPTATNANTYVQSNKPENNSKDTSDESQTTNDNIEGITEIAEYAEIEEMQQLLKRPIEGKPSSTVPNGGTTDPSDNSSRKKRNPLSIFKSGKDKGAKKTDDKKNIKKKGNPNDLELTRLDFTQLKDAIDKMDPEYVTAKMKQVSQPPPVPRQNMKLPDPPDHTYTNTNSLPALIQQTNELNEETDKLLKELQRTSTKGKEPRYDKPSYSKIDALGAKSDQSQSLSSQASKYSHYDNSSGLLDRCSADAKAPQKPPRLNTVKTEPASFNISSSPTSKWGKPTNNIHRITTEPVMENTHGFNSPGSIEQHRRNSDNPCNEPPSSPRSKWGQPIDVSKLRSMPEKQSQIPRPLSPVSPTSGAPLFPVSSSISASYNTPKPTQTTHKSPAFSAAFAKFEPSENKKSPVVQTPKSVLPQRPITGQSSFSITARATPTYKVNVNSSRSPRFPTPENNRFVFTRSSRT